MNAAEALAEIQQKYEILEQQNAVLKATVQKQDAVIEQFAQEILLLKDKRFGRSADVLPEQPDLDLEMVFDEAEVTDAAEAEKEDSVHVESYERKKRGRKPLPEDLPRVQKIIDIPEEDKQCACESRKEIIGQEVSEKLVYVPEELYVLQLVRLIYGCRNCEGSADEEQPAVQSAPLPPAVIPKGIATASLLATVFTNKFVDHLPYYRQEQRFSRLNITISRQDMSNWQLKSTAVLKPLFQLMQKQIPLGEIAHIDETRQQVLKEPMRPNTSKGYMWVVRGGPPDKTVWIYRYDQSRSSDVAKSLLNGFNGYLMSDAYIGYKTLTEKKATGIINVFCWAHSRRKYVDAAKVQKKAGTAHEAVSRIKKLYTIEKELRKEVKDGTLTLEEFTEKRKELIEPVFTNLHEWLTAKAAIVTPSSLVGEAISYTLKNWDQLKRYIQHPLLTPDNNVMEREGIKPFVTGRKNWIFSGSPRGAESSSMLFSLITTAKAHNLNPHVYLYYVLEKAPYMASPHEWEALLPWNVSIPKTLNHAFMEQTLDSLLSTL